MRSRVSTSSPVALPDKQTPRRACCPYDRARSLHREFPAVVSAARSSISRMLVRPLCLVNCALIVETVRTGSNIVVTTFPHALSIRLSLVRSLVQPLACCLLGRLAFGRTRGATSRIIASGAIQHQRDTIV